MSSSEISPLEQAIYDQGVTARMKGFDKKTNPHLDNDLNIKHWWLAGWSDKDLELKKCE
jgi:hypothetical protein